MSDLNHITDELYRLHTIIAEQNEKIAALERKVEALEQCITSMLDSGYRADAVVIRAARSALTAHRQPVEQQPAVPTIFADALRLTADQQEKIANMLANGVSAPEFCRHLNGVNTHAVNRWLKDKGWLFEGAGRYCNWKVTSYARDRYMTERAIEVSSSSGPFSVSKAVLLKKGARWLIHQYMQKRLPMKKTWDGVLEVAV